ncbi:hypothetical protein BHE74_00046056 [Ensete ventricosum]|nr:hypothetical protein BHE74_00046056 [Ensete ventricosum]RZS19730.1 hypothetical protein BHM03_00052164 [Ensete ventricosum]
MASVDLIGAKLEALDTRMEARLCDLFEEFRLGQSPSPKKITAWWEFKLQREPTVEIRNEVKVRQSYTLTTADSFA